MQRQKIVITGLGGLCSLGTDVASIWSAMKQGRSGIGPITRFPTDMMRAKIAAEIAELPAHDLDRKRLMTMDRFGLIAVLAARQAAEQAGLSLGSFDSARAGAVIGAGVFGAEALDEGYQEILVGGKPRPNVFTVPRIMPGAPAGQVSMDLGLRGPVFGVTSACSSANHAIASAADQILLGRADIMLAGGSEAPLTHGIFRAWEALRVLAPDTCRPFSKDRQGLVIGEGAGIIVLEREEHAKARGATILAELAGIGLSGDASDIVSPTVEGPSAAMQACLTDAGLSPSDIDYLNAHGTGTIANDQIETEAIKRVFGKGAYHLSLSSTKSMHGHCLGASGALEMIACVMSMRDSVIPPTANYREVDMECDLDITPNQPRGREVRAAMSNSFAFGGTNAVIAVKAA